METRHQNQKTNPQDAFGTVPSPRLSLKETSYTGTLLKERYRIEGELGRGGIGVVYLARDTQLLQRRVVIKVLQESSENSLHTPWFRKKFDQEIEALVRIDHPGVVGVLDAGAMPDGKPFFVMQFVEGQTLRSVMYGKMDFKRVGTLFRQIGYALTAAHDKGVIHRDLKPENVMIQIGGEGEEIVKLIDFGIATVLDSQTVSTEGDDGRTKVAGALPYMAPEQLRGQPEAASDLWSLGVMAYEAVTGQMPYQADTLVNLHEQQRAGLQALPNRLRPDLPPAAQAAILRALSFDPKTRQPRARDFGEELAHALQAPPMRETIAVTQLAAAETGQLPPTVQLADAVATQAMPNPVLPPNAFNAPAVASPAVPAPAQRPASGRSPLPFFFIGAVLLGLIVGGVSYFKMRNQPGTHVPEKVPAVSAPPAAAQATLSFSLSAQLKKDAQGKLTEFNSPIVFSAGDTLRLKLQSERPGYFYLINESTAPQGNAPLYIFLHPHPKLGEELFPHEQIITLPADADSGFVMDAVQGTEKLWLIWTTFKVPELEKLRAYLNNPQAPGAVSKPEDTQALQAFLSEYATKGKPVVELADNKTLLKTPPDASVLLYLLKLEHR
jgi:predicted Ser/Thr protein kinase